MLTRIAIVLYLRKQQEFYIYENSMSSLLARIVIVLYLREQHTHTDGNGFRASHCSHDRTVTSRRSYSDPT